MRFERTKDTVPVPLLVDEVEVLLALEVDVALVVVLVFVVLDAAVVLWPKIKIRTSQYY